MAMPFGSAGNWGSASVQPAGSVARRHAVEQRRPAPGWRPPRRRSRSASPRARRGRAATTSRACASTSGVDLEGLVRVEAEDLLRRRDLVGAQRGAVDLAGVLLVRRRPADDRAQRDERGLVRHRLAPPGSPRTAPRRPRGTPSGRATPVDVLHVPAVRGEPGRHVLGLRDVRVVLDRDRVVVPDQQQVAQLLVRGERADLVADALFHVAVGGEHVDVVVERALAGRRRPGRTARARGGPPSPCRPRCRGPGRAGRWWSRRRRCGRAPGGPGVSDPHCRSCLRSSSSSP